MWFTKALGNFVTSNIKIKFSCFHRQLFHTTSRTYSEQYLVFCIRNYQQHTQIYSTT